MEKIKSPKNIPLLSKILLFSLVLFAVLTSSNLKLNQIEIPFGFPKIIVPEDNPLSEAKIELGKKLFFEKLLSRDSSISCATCHNPKYAFTDGLEKAKGIKDREVSRNTPTLTNIAYNTSFLRDGVNPSLEAQVIVPIHEKNEFDFHILLAAERLKKKKEYVDLSLAAFGEIPNPKVISNAIASFERTLISGNSRYDQFTFQKDSSALSINELRGMHLFNKHNCVSCHSGFNFTNGEVVNNGLYQHYEDIGKMRVTLDSNDKGAFKVPTLRNVALTAPYMHDGSLKSLEAVVDHYIKGGFDNPNKDNRIKELSLSENDKQDLVAFLKCLTDSSFIVR
jgi:cytochrome c peroxidase